MDSLSGLPILKTAWVVSIPVEWESYCLEWLLKLSLYPIQVCVLRERQGKLVCYVEADWIDQTVWLMIDQFEKNAPYLEKK